MRLMMTVWNFRTWSLQHQTDNNGRPITRSHNSLHTALSTHAISRNYNLYEKKNIILSNHVFSPCYDKNLQNNDYSLFYMGVATFLAPCQFSMKDNFDFTCSSCFQSPTQLHISVFINHFVQVFLVYLITLYAPNHLISWITCTVATTHQLRAT